MLKIAAVSPTGEWEGQYGKMFTAEVELSDGQTGEVNMKTPDKWKVGDEVVITSQQQTKHGIKWKLDRPEGQRSGGGKKHDPDKEYVIGASWAITNALTARGVLPEAKDVPLDKLALRLLKMRDELVDTLKKQNA